MTVSSMFDSRGLSEVLLRFVGGKTHIYRLKSGIYVDPHRWDDKAGRLVIPRLKTPEQRRLLDDQKKLDDLSSFLISTYTSIDPLLVNRFYMQQAVRRFHNPMVVSGRMLQELFERYADVSDVGRARKQRFRSVMNHLHRFEQWRGAPISVDSFSADDLRLLEKFLLTEDKISKDPRFSFIYDEVQANEANRPRGRNTVASIMEVIRGFYRWCKRERITDNNPFDTYEINAYVYGTPYYLTIEERDRIARTNLRNHPSLEIQRDIFIFQCLVGCRVGDLVKFEKKDVVDGFLEYVPRKTKEGRPFVVRVPLVEQASELIKKYDPLPGERLFPFISAQKYNDALKRIFLAARLRRLVSVINPLTREEEKRPLYEVAASHLARRTFIGNLYRKVKDPNIIGSMSGHVEGSRAFSRYRAIDDDMKREIVGLLDGE